MEIYSLDKDNVESFDFLIMQDAVDGIKADDGTLGFVVKDEEEDRHVGGLAGIFTSPTNFEISSIYVVEDARRKGVASKMIDTLYEVIDGIDANISINYAQMNDDQEALGAFLEAKGFEEYNDQDSNIYSLTLDQIENVKLNATSKKVKYISFDEIPSYMFKECMERGKKGFKPIPIGGLESDSIDKRISTGIVDDDKLVGFAVIEKVDDENLMLSSIYVDSKLSMVALTGLLGKAKDKALESYDKNTRLLIPAVTEESRKLISTLFTEDDVDEISYRYMIKAPELGIHKYDEMGLNDFITKEVSYIYAGYNKEEGAYLDETVDYDSIY